MANSSSSETPTPNQLHQSLAKWSGQEQLLGLVIGRQKRQQKQQQPQNEDGDVAPDSTDVELSPVNQEKLVFAALLLRLAGTPTPEKALDIADRHWMHQNEWWEQYLHRNKPPVLAGPRIGPAVVPPLRPGMNKSTAADHTVPSKDDMHHGNDEIRHQLSLERERQTIEAWLARVQAESQQLSIRRASVQLVDPDELGRMQVLQGNTRAQVVLATQLLQQFLLRWEPRLKAVTTNFTRHARGIRRAREELMEVHRRVAALRRRLMIKGLLPERPMDSEAEFETEGVVVAEGDVEAGVEVEAAVTAETGANAGDGAEPGVEADADAEIGPCGTVAEAEGEFVNESTPEFEAAAAVVVPLDFGCGGNGAVSDDYGHGDGSVRGGGEVRESDEEEGSSPQLESLLLLDVAP